MVEKTKLDEIKKVKNLFVLDFAVPAERKEKPKRMYIVAGAFIGAFILSIFILVLLRGFQNIRTQLRTIGK
jgi:uncharacterized protein involved in exopolysaccharide biosynthesis